MICFDCNNTISEDYPRRKRDRYCRRCQTKQQVKELLISRPKQLNLIVHAIHRSVLSGNDSRMSRVFLGEELESWLSRQSPDILRLPEAERHRDHIIPLARLDLTDDRKLQLAFLGFNIKIIHKLDNLRKGVTEIPGIYDSYVEKAKRHYYPHLLTRDAKYAMFIRGIIMKEKYETDTFKPRYTHLQEINESFWYDIIEHQFNDNLFNLESTIECLRSLLYDTKNKHGILTLP